MNVERLITELSSFGKDRQPRFFFYDRNGGHEFKIVEYDQDENDNPTFMLERIES